ncbi:ATP-dependent DNA helicase pif1-like [Mercenaria mercenaria]|uniref:ATP-dependent DNA helicase pif1-like n=1 Tax=Mercenaria mercenaria TaxID=6596 RepID=UPI00234F41A0|nr:ATP-dependent DNA helicase pif1-like [Mercenaria mercenaria]
MLTDLQKEALDRISEGHSLVLTGQAGTGESFLLKRAVHLLKQMKKCVSLLCTTGIGCLQYTDLNATTVHSWAGLQDGRYDNLTLKRLVLEDDRMANVRRNVEKTEAIFIDEVSMLSRKDFEQLELVCRTVSNNDIYFGGLQVVACGDFYQLLPVPNTLYGDLGQFCFESII